MRGDSMPTYVPWIAVIVLLVLELINRSRLKTLQWKMYDIVRYAHLEEKDQPAIDMRLMELASELDKLCQKQQVLSQDRNILLGRLGPTENIAKAEYSMSNISSELRRLATQEVESLRLKEAEKKKILDQITETIEQLRNEFELLRDAARAAQRSIRLRDDFRKAPWTPYLAKEAPPAIADSPELPNA